MLCTDHSNFKHLKILEMRYLNGGVLLIWRPSVKKKRNWKNVGIVLIVLFLISAVEKCTKFVEENNRTEQRETRRLTEEAELNRKLQAGGVTLQQYKERVALIEELESLLSNQQFEVALSKIKGKLELRGFTELNTQLKDQLKRAREGSKTPVLGYSELVKLRSELKKKEGSFEKIRFTLNLPAAKKSLSYLESLPSLLRYPEEDSLRIFLVKEYSFLVEQLETNPHKLKQDLAMEQLSNIGRFVELDIKSWYVGGFGVVPIVTFNVTNNSFLLIKDIKIVCTSYGESGTAIGKLSKTIYEKFEPEKTKTLREINMGFANSQVASLSCEIFDLAF